MTELVEARITCTSSDPPPLARLTLLLERGLEILLLTAFAPLVALYFRDLWQLPAYRAFPLVVVLAAAILWARGRGLACQPALGIPLGSCAVMLSGLLLLAVAATLFSPWLGAVAALMGLAGWISWRRGAHRRHWSSVCVLLGILVFPPWPLVHRMLLGIDQSVVRASSWLLDRAEVDHLPWAAMLQLPGARLFPTQCGLGEAWLLPLLALTAAYLMLWRRPAVPGSLLLLSSGLWYFLLNVACLVAVAVSITGQSISLDERLSLVRATAMVLAVALIVSTDHLLRFLFSPVDPPPNAMEDVRAADYEGEIGDQEGPTLSPLGRAWNFLVGAPSSGRGSGPQPGGSEVAQRRRVALSLAGPALVGVAIAALVLQLPMVPGNPVSDLGAQRLERGVDLELLPPQIGSWTRKEDDSHDPQRDRPSRDFPRRWRYRSAGKVATVVVQPAGRGCPPARPPGDPTWRLLRQTTVSAHDPRSGSDGFEEAFEEAEFARGSQQYGYLAWCRLDEGGRPGTACWLSPVHRLAKPVGKDEAACDLRLFASTQSLLLPYERRDYRSLFNGVREALQKQWGVRGATGSGEKEER